MDGCFVYTDCCNERFVESSADICELSDCLTDCKESIITVKKK